MNTKACKTDIDPDKLDRSDAASAQAQAGYEASMTIYEALAQAREGFHGLELKKSGKNTLSVNQIRSKTC